MCNDMSREKRRCVLTAGESYVMKKTTVCTRQTVAVKNRKWECLIIRKRILILANGSSSNQHLLKDSLQRVR